MSPAGSWSTSAARSEDGARSRPRVLRDVEPHGLDADVVALDADVVGPLLSADHEVELGALGVAGAQMTTSANPACRRRLPTTCASGAAVWAPTTTARRLEETRTSWGAVTLET